MLAPLHRLLVLLTGAAGLIGMCALIGAMMITTVDVILRKVNGEGVFGAVDLVQLMIMSAAYLAIPYTFMIRGHVAVTFFTGNSSHRTTAALEILASGMATFFMGFIAWRGYGAAMDQMMYGDVSMTIGIPMIYYWVPLLTGTALSAVVTLYLFIDAITAYLSERELAR